MRFITLLFCFFIFILCIYCQPSNIDCTSATELYSGEPLYFQTTIGSPTIFENCFPFGSPIVFYSYFSRYDFSIIHVSTCSDNTDFDTFISVYVDDCTNICSNYADSTLTSTCNPNQAEITFHNDFSNVNYYFSITSTDGSSGYFDIRLDEIQHHFGQDCFSPIPVYHNIPIVDSNYYTNFDYNYLPISCTQSSSPLVLYSYTTLLDLQNIRISVCKADFDSDITIIADDCSICYLYNDAGANCPNFESEITITAPEGFSFIIVAGGYYSYSQGVYTLEVVETVLYENCNSALPLENNVPYFGYNFATPTEPFDSCFSTHPSKQVAYFSYQTLYDFGDILITTCESDSGSIDSIISVFIGDCNSLTCIAENDDYCSLRSSIKLENFFPSETDLIIAVYDFGTNEGSFTILVKEVFDEELNGDCNNPRTLFNGGLLSGSTTNSLSFRREFDSCGSSSFDSSPIVFYNYTTLYDFGDLTVSTCSYANFDTAISIFLNDCDNLVCLNENDDFCERKSSYTLDSSERLESGTNIIIGVFGFGDDYGDFSILVSEREIIHPPNELCGDAIELTNAQTIGGNSRDSITLRNSLPDCATLNTFNFSPVVFYYYITQYNYGSLQIGTCTGAAFDTALSLYIGSCPTLTCFAENNDNVECRQNAKIELSHEERLPKDTQIIIAVHGNLYDVGGFFTLTVTESGYSEPINSKCENATIVYNDDSAPGITLGSSFISNMLPPCGSPFSLGSPVVFYKYTTLYSASSITIDTCTLGDFDTFISVYKNCSELQCIASANDGCGELSEVQLFGQDSNTELIIAIYGNKAEEAGSFVLSIEEATLCSEEGPEYQCQTSSSIYTDHKCEDGEQCVFVPSFDLGFCFDPEGCDCVIEQLSGVVEGEELHAGTYEIRSQAVNLIGITSDICSFRINVLDTCNPEGPAIHCNEDLTFFTTPFCEVNGEPCYEFSQVFLGTCEDNINCHCDLYQIDGPSFEEKLTRGDYTITVKGINDMNYESIDTCTILVHVL